MFPPHVFVWQFCVPQIVVVGLFVHSQSKVVELQARVWQLVQVIVEGQSVSWQSIFVSPSLSKLSVQLVSVVMQLPLVQIPFWLFCVQVVLFALLV